MAPKKATKAAAASTSTDDMTSTRTRNAKSAPEATAASTRPKRTSAAIADSQPEPKKARTGRKPAIASQPKKTKTTSSKQAESAPAANASKPRGRPPKISKEAPVSEEEERDEDEAVVEKAPPRKRGRPSKSAESAPTSSTPRAKSAAGTAKAKTRDRAAPSRGRGRPALKKTSQTTVVDGTAESAGKKRSAASNDEDGAEADGQVEAAEPAAKRRRGRPSTKPSTHDSDNTNSHQITTEDPSYWLMKAEPESRLEKGIDVKFSIDDLEAAKEPEAWNGVRNHVAKNNMKSMKKGEKAFFYHSNCKTPGIVGTMEIVKEASPDESALNKNDPYYDPKATRDNPNGWVVVHVEFRQKFDHPVFLDQLKNLAKDHQEIENLPLLKQPRLSVSKVSPEEWNFILKQAGADDTPPTEPDGEPKALEGHPSINGENTTSTVPKLAPPSEGKNSGGRATSVPAHDSGKLAPPKKAGSRASSRARSVPPSRPTAESGPAGPIHDTPISQAMARVVEEMEP